MRSTGRIQTQVHKQKAGSAGMVLLRICREERGMSLYLCKEEMTENGGYLVPIRELIQCKDCKHYTSLGKNGLWGRCSLHASRVETARTCQSVDYCSWAEREEE